MRNVKISFVALLLLCGILISSCEIMFSKPGATACEEHDADCVKDGHCSGHPNCAAHENCPKDKLCTLHPECVKYELRKQNKTQHK